MAAANRRRGAGLIEATGLVKEVGGVDDRQFVGQGRPGPHHQRHQARHRDGLRWRQRAQGPGHHAANPVAGRRPAVHIVGVGRHGVGDGRLCRRFVARRGVDDGIGDRATRLDGGGLFSSFGEMS